MNFVHVPLATLNTRKHTYQCHFKQSHAHCPYTNQKLGKNWNTEYKLHVFGETEKNVYFQEMHDQHSSTSITSNDVSPIQPKLSSFYFQFLAQCSSYLLLFYFALAPRQILLCKEWNRRVCQVECKFEI